LVLVHETVRELPTVTVEFAGGAVMETDGVPVVAGVIVTVASGDCATSVLPE
jgi:hypothetical protein